jgi:hypothetical protein
MVSASPESHAQDGEKLSRVHSDTGKQQRLAILPWHFEPCLVARAILVGSCQIAGRAYRCRLNERTRDAHPLHETHRARTPCAE